MLFLRDDMLIKKYFKLLIFLCAPLHAMTPIQHPTHLPAVVLADDFYKNYLEKYYPKVNVIKQQWMTVLPDDIEKALGDIVAVLAYDPWLYFANTPKGFKVTRHWECVVDQLSYINTFLSKAWISVDGKKICMPSYHEILNGPPGATKTGPKPTQLVKYLTRPGRTTIYDFYALCFDYIIKLFNEGVLMQEITQAVHYFIELETMAEKLRGSAHESEYMESIRTAHELLNLLKQRLGIDRELSNQDLRMTLGDKKGYV